jgi:uncharacterized protein with von Willebrand factor type A (vWA) domain
MSTIFSDRKKNMQENPIQTNDEEMFLIPFFYLLRSRGLDVTPNEWLGLIDALCRGLVRCSLMEFYHLARALLAKNEQDYDNFDTAFYEFFKGVEPIKDIPDEFLKWLEEDVKKADLIKLMGREFENFDIDELMKMLEERIAEQNEKHDGGNYWIGTGGTSPFGWGGYHPGGIRIGGVSMNRSAIKVAGERHFRDFRGDNILDTRQYQMAFRRLRKFSNRVDSNEREFDVDETIKKTSENAGKLKLAFTKPRKSIIKLLLLFDSDGSMRMHSELCSSLFQATDKSEHFKDLKVYYFHNCIYEHLYKNPYCKPGDWVETEWVLNNLSNEYMVIVIGDAYMAPSELTMVGGNISYYLHNDKPGLHWLKKIRNMYKSSVWLNPIPKRYWTYSFTNTTIDIVRDIFPMFELTIDGLDEAIGCLLNRH